MRVAIEESGELNTGVYWTRLFANAQRDGLFWLLLVLNWLFRRILGICLIYFQLKHLLGAFQAVFLLIDCFWRGFLQWGHLKPRLAMLARFLLTSKWILLLTLKWIRFCIPASLLRLLAAAIVCRFHSRV